MTTATAQDTTIVARINDNPVLVLTNAEEYTRFHAAIVAEVDAHVPDVKTDKGRKEIASLAYKVTRTKTAIDAAGKKLNEAARQQINAVDAQRRKIWDEMEVVANRARQPLTEWEEAEAARIATIKGNIAHIEAVGRGFIGPEMYPYGMLFRELEEKVTLNAETFGEFLPEAQRAHAEAHAKLTDGQARQYKEMQEREELERLRAESAERARKDAEAQAAKDAAEAEARATAEALRQRQAEEERAAHAAQQERERIQREEEAKAQAAVREAEERAQAAEREAARIRREDEERQKAAAAEAKRIEDERLAREADQQHRTKLMREAEQHLITFHGMTADGANALILDIIGGAVPHTSFKF